MDMTTGEALGLLNGLRAGTGMPSLGTWKESRERLVAAIEALLATARAETEAAEAPRPLQ